MTTLNPNKLKAQANTEQWLANIESGFVSIDSSNYSNTSCPRKSLLSYIQKYVPAGGRSALIFGHMLHELLEWQLKTIETFNSETQKLFLEKASSIALSEGPKLNNCFDDRRNTDLWLALVHAYSYNLLAKGPAFIPLSFNNEKMVEKSFSIPLGDITVAGKKVTLLWEGRLDCLARCARTNFPVVVDHKTTTMLGDKFLDDKMRSVQFTGYLFAGNYFGKALDISFEDVLINCFCNKKTGFEFQTFRFKRPYSQIEEWRLSTLANMEYKVNLLYSHLTKNTLLPLDLSHCCPKFGKCEFFQVCEAPLPSRDNFLNSPSIYGISDWSPLND